MKILYIGAGFVGACSAAVAASGGHQTLVYDIDKKRVDALSSGDRDTIEKCLFEEGLGDLLVRNNERITFTTNYQDVQSFAETGEAIFMCLPTPEVGESGQSDLTYYQNALKQLAPVLAKRNNGSQSQYITIVNKSTVPIGTAEQTTKFLKDQGVAKAI
jgi:UDPglucose 6-dehydrogenase